MSTAIGGRMPSVFTGRMQTRGVAGLVRFLHLRTDTMLMFMPYYFVAFFILREELRIKKSEILGFILLILLVATSLFIEK